jgi:hypothetical protein
VAAEVSGGTRSSSEAAIGSPRRRGFGGPSMRGSEEGTDNTTVWPQVAIGRRQSSAGGGSS